MKKQTELPKFITSYITSSHKLCYRVRMSDSFLDFKVNKSFYSLEDAIIFKDEQLDVIDKLKNEKDNYIRTLEIDRNKDNIAFIKLNYKSENYECLVSDIVWHDLVIHGEIYYDGNYAKIKHNNQNLQLNRYLYLTYVGEQQNDVIDHYNQNKLDNRLENLIDATNEENMFNRTTVSKWGYRGVCKKRKTFWTSIQYKYNTIWKGPYNTKEEAALEWNKLALEFYPRYANRHLNIIQ